MTTKSIRGRIGMLALALLSSTVLAGCNDDQINQLNARTNQLEAAVSGLNGELQIVKTDVQVVKTDVQRVKTDMVTVQGEVSDIKSDVRGLERFTDLVLGLSMLTLALVIAGFAGAVWVSRRLIMFLLSMVKSLKEDQQRMLRSIRFMPNETEYAPRVAPMKQVAGARYR